MSKHQYIELINLLSQNNCTVITGAGISTYSGIPDYRDPKTKHIKRNPMMHDHFVKSESARKRFWARALKGYVKMKDAQPNLIHNTLTKWQNKGIVNRIITQNVDGLHQAANSKNVIELHGNLHEVICLSCNKIIPRLEYNNRLIEK